MPDSWSPRSLISSVDGQWLTSFELLLGLFLRPSKADDFSKETSVSSVSLDGITGVERVRILGNEGSL